MNGEEGENLSYILKYELSLSEPMLLRLGYVTKQKWVGADY